MKHLNVLSFAFSLLLVAGVAAQTLEESCQKLLKQRLSEYSGTSFGRAVNLGDVGIYESALKSVKIKVVPGLGPIARYDPNTQTIELSRDPRTLTKPEELRAVSDTIWHETTHRIEDQNGDFKPGTSVAYDERNVEYMTHLFDVVFAKLKQLEDRAKSGAKPDDLRKMWEGFLKSLEDAKKVPGVPVDPRQLRSYFGVEIDVMELERMYLDEGAHPAIREALGGIVAKPVVPKGGAWVLTRVVPRPGDGRTEAQFRAMAQTYADSEAQVRGVVRPGSSLFTFKIADRSYVLGAEWSRPASLMKPGQVLQLTAKASDQGCANTPDGDGTFVSFDVALWGSNDGANWYGYAINLGSLYGNPKKNAEKVYKITFPAAKVKELHLVVRTGGIHWAREIAYVYAWRDR